MDPTRMPFASELFARWRQARGDRPEPARRPFSRSWEEVLEQAGLLSAEERQEAECDARALAAEGWLELRSVRYKPYLLERIVLPLDQEERWCAAFGFVSETDAEARRRQEFAWQPELEFLGTARINLPWDDLQNLNAYLARRSYERPRVPIKERSLEIFGDEKRLDALRASSLFGSGRLELELHLGCEIVGEPLGWKRGPTATGHVIILENAATWHTYERWNQQVRAFSAVIYGRGLQTAQSTRYLRDILAELPGPQRVWYFGDLDLPGVQIPQQASAYAQSLGLPPLEAHLPSYRWLLEQGRHRATPWDGSQPAHREDCDWLGDLAEECWTVLSANRRIAQEVVGWDFLRERTESRLY